MHATSKKPNRIYLIGYMGSGKTTVGKKLAHKLNYRFVDLDDVIEKKAGYSITEIFQQQGESFFRQLEHEALKETFLFTNTVISTGGGTPIFFNNMEQMNAQGITIYIELSPKSLVDRLKDSAAKRPLIMDKTEAELLQFIETGLQQREPYYKKAEVIANGISLTVETIIQALQRQ